MINFVIRPMLFIGVLLIGLTISHARADEMDNPFVINRNSLSSVSSSGHSISSLTTLALSAGHEFNQTVSNRQNKLHSFSNGTGTSDVFFGKTSNGDIEIQKKAEKVFDAIGKQLGFSENDMGSRPQFWTSDFKRKGFVGNDNGLSAYNYDLNGFSGGADIHAGNNWNFGIAAGYTRAVSHFEALASTATAVDAYQASFYATYEHASGSIDNHVSFNKFDTHSTRSIMDSDVNNMADASGKGYHIAWTLSAMGHANLNGFSLTPLTGFTFTRLHRGGLTEHGAGHYNLNSEPTDSTSFKPMIGIDIARHYTIQSTIDIVPEFYGILHYETMDAAESATNHLQQLETLCATSRTALSRHSMQLGGSVSIKTGDRFTSKIQFDSDVQPGSHSYSGTLKVNYNW